MLIATSLIHKACGRDHDSRNLSSVYFPQPKAVDHIHKEALLPESGKSSDPEAKPKSSPKGLPLRTTS